MRESVYQLSVRHFRGLSSFRRGELDIAAFDHLLGHRFDVHGRFPVRST
jgi:hypothetical protein